VQGKGGRARQLEVGREVVESCLVSEEQALHCKKENQFDRAWEKAQFCFIINSECAEGKLQGGRKALPLRVRVAVVLIVLSGGELSSPRGAFLDSASPSDYSGERS